MNLTFAKKLYASSPPFIQSIFFNALTTKHRLTRYGSSYKALVRELLASQWLAPDEIQAYQDRELRRIVTHAYKTVPYYKTLFDSLQLDVREIQTTADLAKVPTLSKDQVRENSSDLLSRAVKPKDRLHGHTSGTTGSPLSLTYDINCRMYTDAVDHRQKIWGNVKEKAVHALLLGPAVVDPNRTSPPFWQMDFANSRLWLSSFHLNSKYVSQLYNQLLQRHVKSIEGYPSTLYSLARLLKENDLPIKFDAAFTSSETLHAIQRETIEEVFQCKLLDFYGLAERTAFATECGLGSGKHLNFEYAVNEITNLDGDPVMDGQAGRLTGTSLTNYAMPLIRYVSSDITAILPGQCDCGRHMKRIENISTKAEDQIITPSGRLVSPSYLTHPFKPLKHIVKSQICQTTESEVLIRLVVRSGYDEAEEKLLTSEMQQRLGKDVNIHVELVEDIPVGANGKYRWVISNVAANRPST